MGLYTTLSNENKQVLETKTITHSCSRLEKQYTYQPQPNVLITNNNVFEHRLFVNYKVKWVGIDKDVVKDLAQGLADEYTKSFYGSEWVSTGENAGTFAKVLMGQKCMIDIQVEQVAGCMYQITAIGNEEYTQLSTLASDTPNWDYELSLSRPCDDDE